VATASKLREELAALRIDRSQVRRSSGRGWTLAVIFFAALIIAGGIGLYVAFGDQLQRPMAVRVDTVRLVSLGQVNTVLTATGYLESRQQAAVGAKSPGRVAQVLVEEGDKVKKGDLLAELEHADLDAMLASRKVQVHHAEAMLNEAKRVVAQRERDFAREQSLFEKRVGTQAALETAETEYHTAAVRVQALSASVELAKAQVHEAEEAVCNMRVVAPFDGTVVTKDAEVGETIMPGGMGLASGRGSVATLANLDMLEVDTDVKEDYLGGLEKGQPAEVAVDAVPNRRYQGKLREIIPMGDRTRGVVKVKVSILDPDEHLFPDLGATVHFQPAKSERPADAGEKKLFVNRAAIVREGNREFVWRLEQGHVAQVTVASEGEAKDGLMLITGAIRSGERVILDPSPELAEGMKVRVEE
jgi:RND family efflux transporter MFP subunit